MKGKVISRFKFNWNRLVKKKWFFPAVYLGIVAIVLTVILSVQQLEKKVVQEEIPNKDPLDEIYMQEDAEEVVQREEMVKMPLDDFLEATIVTKFFDYDATPEEQEKSVTFYHNRYYQSKGVHIQTADEKPFDVLASLSGTVVEVKEDPLLGNVVVLSHEDGVTTYYASLGETTVEKGDKVDQGDKLGLAGKNIFNEESGVHVHFELHKDDQEVNPEVYFNEPLQNLLQATNAKDEPKEEVEEETESAPMDENEELEEAEETGDEENDEEESSFDISEWKEKEGLS